MSFEFSQWNSELYGPVRKNKGKCLIQDKLTVFNSEDTPLPYPVETSSAGKFLNRFAKLRKVVHIMLAMNEWKRDIYYWGVFIIAKHHNRRVNPDRAAVVCESQVDSRTYSYNGRDYSITLPTVNIPLQYKGNFKEKYDLLRDLVKERKN